MPDHNKKQMSRSPNIRRALRYFAREVPFMMATHLDSTAVDQAVQVGWLESTTNGIQRQYKTTEAGRKIIA